MQCYVQAVSALAVPGDKLEAKMRIGERPIIIAQMLVSHLTCFSDSPTHCPKMLSR